MSTINLSNPRLRKYIRDVLEIEKYGEPFATLIEEAFIREQYVLELNPLEFYEDLCNFKNTIKCLKFGKCSSNCLGVTYPDRGEIVFNFDYWQNLINKEPMDSYCTKFFETFAHECLHGMQIDTRTYKNRAGGYNQYIGNRAHAIYEICTQGTAAKMARNRTGIELDKNLILTGDGYSNEIFAVPLISATFGVSERDVLKYGMRRREELIKALDKNIGNIAKTTELVNKIELQLEYMHSIQYPDENQKEFKDLSYEEKRREATNAIINLVKISQEALATRIKSTPLNFDKNIAIQYKYEQRKIIDTLRQELRNYSYNFEKDYNEFLADIESGKNADYIKKSINVFEQIGKNYNGALKKAPLLITAVKIEDFEYCKRNGIELNGNDTHSIVDEALNFKEKKMHEDYNDLSDWNNTKIVEAIYNGRKITEHTIGSQNRLDKWQSINTPIGYQKREALRIALTENKNKYQLESKQYILEFFNTPEYELNNFYRRFTRNGNAREIFSRNFRTGPDREFLAKLIADRYITKNFNLDGTKKKKDTDREQEMQNLFFPTMQKYGKTQLIHAIAEMLVNDNYQFFSNENCRTMLAIYGKRTIFDTIAQPLFDEMLNHRTIIPEKNVAFQKAIYETERAHPDTTASRIAKLVEIYKQTEIIDSNLFSRGGRQEFARHFSSQRDIEDMIGLICDNYSKKYIKTEKNTKNSKIDFDKSFKMLDSIIDSNGEDYFRENIIRAILYNDYSGFTSVEDINCVRSISHTILLEHLSQSYIEDAKVIEKFNRDLHYNPQPATPANIIPILKKQKMSKINKVLNGLIDAKQKNNQIYAETQNDIERA